MKTSDFDYHLPEGMIAQRPVEPRDASRLMVVNRATGRIEHSVFRRLGEFLKAGDLLVVNDTRVIQGRVRARRKGTGGRVEFLLLRRLSEGVWQGVGRPGRRMRPGERYEVERAGVEVGVRERGEDGTLTLGLSTEVGMGDWGETPLPPYIRETLDDPERYQTVYAKDPGSAAAPTAGLHFTRELMEDLESRGVDRANLTLHVGLDTFRPVTEEDPRRHQIHKEFCRLDEAAAEKINGCRRGGGRVVAVGTTCVRTLEQTGIWSRGKGASIVAAVSGWAELLILPGYRFRMVDVMITNFHLPRSTTLMMTAAFAGKELLMEAYEEAIKNGYRFYSFGDAMLIL